MFVDRAFWGLGLWVQISLGLGRQDSVTSFSLVTPQGLCGRLHQHCLHVSQQGTHRRERELRVLQPLFRGRFPAPGPR